VFSALKHEPQRISVVAHSSAALAALRRLADAGLATIAAFTPSDAMHVLGRQQGWNREAAELGARILATEERNARAARTAVTPEQLCERTYEYVLRETGRILLATALAIDPGIEARSGHWGLLGDRLIEAVVAGENLSGLVRSTFGLAQPLIAIGAPVGAYYPEVARRLGTSLSIPEHARCATRSAPWPGSLRRALPCSSTSRPSGCFVCTIRPAFLISRSGGGDRTCAAGFARTGAGCRAAGRRR